MRIEEVDYVKVLAWAEEVRSFTRQFLCLDSGLPRFLPSMLDRNFTRTDDCADFYARLQYELIEAIDLQHTIYTKRVEDSYFVNGVGYIRNALGSAFSPKAQLDDFHNIAANMLLRCLTIARAIHFVLVFSGHCDAAYLLNRHVLTLISQIIVLQNRYNPEQITANNVYLEAINIEFNSKLIAILHRHNLDDGIGGNNISKQYSKLLDYYRYLSCTLDPAPGVITLWGNEKITAVDIAQPITKKTDVQLAFLACLSSFGCELGRDFQSVLPRAYQVANKAFALLIQSDDRALSAQMRSYIAPGVKNAFFNTSLIFDSDSGQLLSNRPFIRASSAAYSGHRLTNSAVAREVVNNCYQLKEAAKSFGASTQLHFQSLLTDSLFNFEYQHDIVQSIRAAQHLLPQSGSGFSFSLTSINFEGMFYRNVIAPAFLLSSNELTNQRRPFNRAQRTRDAEMVLEVAQRNGYTPVIGCASAQDRTGVIAFMYSVNHFVKVCRDNGIEVNLATISSFCALAGHSQFLATIFCPGSSGLKTSSNPNLFSNLVAQCLFTDTANTNKGAPVGKSSLPAVLQSVEYRDEINKLLRQYVQQASGLFGGLFLIHCYALRREKVGLVNVFLKNDQSSESPSFDAYKKSINVLVRNCNAAKQRHFFYSIFPLHLRRPSRLDETLQHVNTLLGHYERNFNCGG